jgi:GNAT superfamily N-acetyltransferase
MTITIRHALPSDADAVLALMRELSEHEELSEYFHLTRDALLRYCFDAPPRLEILVAVDGETIVGYATWMAQLSPWAGRDFMFLDDLYVTARMRGSGIGALLMKRIGEIAVQRDVEVRWHVQTENVAAQKFYQSMGAELRSRFVAYWMREAIVRFSSSPTP